jgi:glutamate racemase
MQQAAYTLGTLIGNTRQLVNTCTHAPLLKKERRYVMMEVNKWLKTYAYQHNVGLKQNSQIHPEGSAQEHACGGYEIGSFIKQSNGDQISFTWKYISTQNLTTKSQAISV